ncbi:MULTISPECIES: hypothetical protein [Enterococcus]|jgi:hypothetical protein|uniref:DUF4351 domain-containing protein n=2 Tax=Enterococcus durans TaxID=53345 RepID=A0AB36S840_9ENTE|nr:MULTISPECIES: hypothetical protein [Enterococcus]DAJ09862.1 MAG TPA: hypothetical protein [Caudoviricetes sp.]AOM34550.1 hypothetical protein AL021_09150 [Enterococcus faecium]EGP5571956.1 hypothetical protein [Enterococcus faecium]ELB36790.1 hypothetical protein OK9_03545 [Enterococcus faecium EnGen0033]EOT36254.1 hypothetical protein OMS_00101 [Enterococcus durans ATCC 6056]
MALEMRELRGDDLFSLLSIVGKLDIKDEFVKMFEKNIEDAGKTPEDHKEKKLTKAEQAKIDKETQKRGMKIMAALLQKTLLNLKNVKSDINELFAELTNTDIQTISTLGLIEYTELLTGFFKKPELASFFSSIATLL